MSSSSSQTSCPRTYTFKLFVPPECLPGGRDPEREKLFNNTNKYRKLLSSTEGFYAGDWAKKDLNPIYGGIYGWPKTCRDARNAARLAVSHYNELNGMNLEFKTLIRVNAQVAKAINFFLTLEASDGFFYEAKVFHMTADDRKVEFMRPARYYPSISPDLNHLIGPEPSPAD